MIELLLKLIEKVKELAEVREKHKDKIFEKLIEPTYNELQLIHQDYVESLTELLQMVPRLDDDDNTRIEKCDKSLKFLEERRLKYEAVRAKLWAFETIITRFGLDDDAKRFLEAVESYLRQELSIGQESTLYTIWIDTLEELRRSLALPQDRKYDLEILNEDLADRIKRNRDLWQKVSNLFVEMKVAAISR